MPAIGEDGVEAQAAPMEYEVLKQRVDLDVDFPHRALKGSTEITLQPLIKDLRYVRLHCRQCRPSQIQIGGITARWDYDDPYRQSRMSANSTVHQHEMLKSKIQASLRPVAEPQLTIALPPKLKIQELHMDSVTALPSANGASSLSKQESDVMAAAETPVVEKMQQQVQQFAPIKLTIEFEVDNFREGLHWVGCDGDDGRYPYFYTKCEPWPGNTSSIFPCLDDATSRCSWEIAIRSPRTVGDAFRKPKTASLPNRHGRVLEDADVEMTDVSADLAPTKADKAEQLDGHYINLSTEEAALELAVICVGEAIDDVADLEDETRHMVTFSLSSPVAARHVAFAVGPFERVNLAESRTTEEEGKLGETAVKVDGWCLPGRADELENTCFPMCSAIDFISVNYGRFPFPAYQMLFVDDAVHDTAAAGGLSICSTRLLFPEDIIEPLDRNTRALVRAVADQWSGVYILAKEPTDAWVIAGIAGYLTDVFMRKLAGNNQYRWEQKLASEKVYDLDVDRPSIYQLGHLLHLDHSIRDFLNLKSALVLGILDRRLVKSSGSTGCLRIISKIFLNAKTGSLVNGELSTQDFQRTCEKLGHNKLESFFRQWVMGAGCPIFQCSQRFNKKKLVVEMTIVQRQLERQTKPAFEPSNFMREVKEHVQEVWAPETQGVFTGPMTIRIHEADGTPYEHIVEIKEPITKLEIPYNTKYKRLKRSRRQKERAIAEGHTAGEGGEDSLLYCLGDILDTPQEMRDWDLADWTKEDEDKMGQESYEWIRMDADFEWIGKIHLVMPLYMYISQLQQDRDLVAQFESMRYLLGSNPHHVSLSILVRTLMDERYFYGIRVMAADGLAKLARDKLMDVGQKHLMKAFTELFCENEVMPRPNDFSSRVTFIMQCAIPKAMAQLRDVDGKVPLPVRQFFVDKLKFNDNSDNGFADYHYVATLMTCLADSLAISHRVEIRREAEPTYQFAFGEEEPEEPEIEEFVNPDADFEEMAVKEIERYRRIDEWIMTYQNVYSTTAIECLQKLTKAGVVKDKTIELFRYTDPSTADNVRLAAFRCLNEIGLSKKMSVMKHLLHSLVKDNSPYFRDRLLQCFGEALGHIAFGDDSEKRQAQALPTDGLVLDEGGSNEARRIEATRRTTPEGAIAALRATLENEDAFKQSLWYAATSPKISLDEAAAFCDVAALMYEPITSHTIMLKMPRPYRCEHVGPGKVRFYPHGAYRWQPSKGLSLDDHLTLQGLSLKYNGPLGEDVLKALAAREEQESIKIRYKEAQLKLQTLQGAAAQQAQNAMPPPATVPTPLLERPALKLNLGGAKRKASVDLSAEREGSPKTIKLSSKPSTPGGGAQILKAQRKSSSLMLGRTTSPMVLKLSPAGARRAQEIVSSPPQPGRSTSGLSPNDAVRQSSFSAAQQLPLPSTTLPASMSQSPSAGSSFATPPPSLTAAKPLQLNLGGFRSFGGAPDTGMSTSFTASPVAESIKAESASPAAVNGLSGSPPAPPSLTSLTSMSPPPKDSHMAPPLPKKKLTLKLGARTASGQGSPPAS